MLQHLKSKVHIIKVIGVLLLIHLFLLCGCAYFNTFYNAKKFYRKAEKENKDKKENINPQNYRKAIDTAAKIPEFYPDSKYIDDALFMMGKSYYRIGEYPKAQRKFEELITNYPQSEFIEEIKLFLGRSLIKNNNKDRARELLTRLGNLSEREDIRVEAKLALGELLFEDEKYNQAADLYQKLGQNAKDKTVRHDALFLEAECYFALEDYAAAAKTYQQAAKYRKVEKEKRFQTRYNWGYSTRLTGDYAGAMEIFQSIRDDDKMYEYYPQVELQIAEIEYELGDVDKSVNNLLKITEKHSRTTESAKAYFDLGLIQRDAVNDFDSALVLLGKVKSEKGNSPYADSAQIAIDVINNWINLNKSIDNLRQAIVNDENTLAGIDSSAIEPDSLRNPAMEQLFEENPELTQPDSIILETVEPPTYPEPRFPGLPPDSVELMMHRMMTPESSDSGRLEMLQDDSLDFLPDSLLSTIPDSMQAAHKDITPPPEPAGIDTAAILKRIDDNRKKISQSNFHLAEIWYFQLDRQDSAKAILTQLADSAETELASQAVFLMSYIARQQGEQSTSDSLNRILIDKYGDTEYANIARKRLNLPIVETTPDSGRILFLQAERLLFDEDRPNDAWDNYALVDSLFPDSPYAPKALYARAWIAEYTWEKDSAAVELLTYLREKYPEDTLSAVAGKKLTLQKSSSASRQRSEPTGAPAPQGREEGERVFLPEEVSQPARVIEDSSAISQIILQNDLYPQRALSSHKNGVVIISLVVDRYGFPYDMEVTREVPGGYDFAEAALLVVELLTYEVGKSRGEPVPVRIEVKIFFKTG